MSDPRDPENEQRLGEIGAAGPDNWSEIRSLHALAFRRLAGPSIEPGQCEAFVARIYAPDYTAALETQDLRVAWYDGRAIGTAGWVPSDDSGTVARLTSVFVSPLYTRLGIGRRLVVAAEARARAAGFGTFAVRAFQPSAGFFEAVGYIRSSQGVQSVGTENGIPVVFMRKHIAATSEADTGRRTGTMEPPASSLST